MMESMGNPQLPNDGEEAGGGGFPHRSSLIFLSQEADMRMQGVGHYGPVEPADHC